MTASHLAFSAASFRRCRAIASLRMSMPSALRNSSAMWLMSTSSKSSPPSGVAVGGHHLEHAVADVEDRDVKGAAAEVEDRDLLVGLLSRP